MTTIRTKYNFERTGGLLPSLFLSDSLTLRISKMKYIAAKLFVVAATLVIMNSCSETTVYNSPQALEKGIRDAAPGDTLLIATGEWKDVQLTINKDGSAEKHIVIAAQEAGGTVFTGNSFIEIGGSFIEIYGILFKDGSSDKKPVISFKSKKKVANNSRISNCAIYYFNPSDRFLKNSWVELYGKNNRVDHCSFVGKLNSGVTLAVKLNGVENQNNEHLIDHNYFADRPRLGSNGGETMRVGTSTFSLTSSKTRIENNYFEECNGEVEIASIKSCDNYIANNTFYECEGVFTLRHGNNNIIENNTFIGNNKPHTGGVRVINSGHTIINNHFQELAGDRFRSGFGVMNGVPNSAINRYHQVTNADITSNTFINCDNIAFGVGSDNERTATPKNVTFNNNSIYNSKSNVVYKALDDISGISFNNNSFTLVNGNFSQKGFEAKELVFNKNADGLYASEDYQPKLTATKDNTGADWFSKEKSKNTSAKRIKVTLASNLHVEIVKANSGDTLVISESGTYEIEEPMLIDKHITIVSNLHENPVIKYNSNKKKKPLFMIKNNGSLSLYGIDINGFADDGISLSAIATEDKPFIAHYNLVAEDCNFYNFNEGKAQVLTVTKSSYADSIVFNNCTFSNISGMALNLKAEIEDRGKYSAEYVVLRNCLFEDVMGSALNLYRGGNDESTLGPFLTIDQCTFHNVENKELGSCLNLNGVQWISITNSIFSECGKSGRVIKLEDQGWITCVIDYCNFYNSGRFESYYDNRLGENVWYENPQFISIEENNFELDATSALHTKSNKQQCLGYQQ